jgi:hypothetical protein
VLDLHTGATKAVIPTGTGEGYFDAFCIPLPRQLSRRIRTTGIRYHTNTV